MLHPGFCRSYIVASCRFNRGIASGEPSLTALVLQRIAPAAIECLQAGVAELVDARDSKSRSARSVGSIPSTGTNIGLASVCGIEETRLEGQAAIEVAKHPLLSAGLILAIGTATGLLAQKIKIPDVAVSPIVG